MSGSARIEKLRVLFGAAPAPVLMQLRAAMELGAETDPEGLPYDELCTLIDEVAAGRGIMLTATAGQPDTAAEADTVAQPEAAAQPDEPLILEEAAQVTAEIDENGAFVPPRNAMHAFFGPFEPLIIDPPKFQPRLDGYICSTSLPAIWRLLNEEASGSVIRDAWIKAELLPEPEEQDFYRQIADQMHLAARSVLDDLTASSRVDPAIRRALISRLGGNATLGDLFEFQTLLPLAGRLAEAFSHIRPLLANGTDENFAEIAEIIATAAQSSPALAGYLQLSVLSYMAEPWRALRLQTHLRDGSMPGGAESCLIADHLIAFVTAQPEWLERLILQGAFKGETVEAVMGFSVLVGGLSTELESVPDSDLFQNRLKPVIASGGDVFAVMTKQAMAAIHDVLPLKDGEGGTFEPDIGWIAHQQMRHALIEEAYAAAGFLTGAKPAAEALDQVSLLKRARQRVEEEIDAFSVQLVEAIQRASGPDRLQAVRMSKHVEGLAGHVMDEAAAKRLRQRFDEAARAA